MIGKQRNFGLDVVRAISITFVLIAHKFVLPFELGLLGVQIFFILSGFLIGQILIRDFYSSGTFNTVIKFWKRRWYRTLPLYYLILVLKILIYGNPYGWKMIVYFFFLQANFVGIDFFGVSWSLIVEEWFYIFLPLSTLFFFSKGISSKNFVIYLVSFILFFLISRFFWNYFEKGIIIYQFDCLLLGVLLATVKVYYNFIYKKLNSVFMLILGCSGLCYFTLTLGNISQVPLYAPYYRVVLYFLLSLCICLIIPFVEQSTFINDRLKKVYLLYLFFTWTSVLTYAIYLIHMEIFQIDFHLSFLLNSFVQMVLLYSISYVIFIFYEHPFMNLRDEFSFRKFYSSLPFMK